MEVEVVFSLEHYLSLAAECHCAATFRARLLSEAVWGRIENGVCTVGTWRAAEGGGDSLASPLGYGDVSRRAAG